MKDLIESLKKIARDSYVAKAMDTGTHEGAVKAAQTRKAHGFGGAIKNLVNTAFNKTPRQPSGWSPKVGFNESGSKIPTWVNVGQAKTSAPTVQKTKPVSSSPFKNNNPTVEHWRRMADWNLKRDGDMWVG